MGRVQVTLPWQTRACMFDLTFNKYTHGGILQKRKRNKRRNKSHFQAGVTLLWVLF